MRLLGGGESCLKSGGRFAMNLVNTDGIPENEIKAINRMVPYVSGFALLTLFRKCQANPAVELLKDRGIPFVCPLSWPTETYQDNINFAMVTKLS
jgi:hypothetical protein